MLQIVPHMRVLVARGPLDLRCGIDGTAAACRQVLFEDPMSGAVFVFRNRSGTMIRILVYDGQGFWLMTKRLSKGRFRFWCTKDSQAKVVVKPHELVTLLAGGDWTRVPTPAPWRPLPSPPAPTPIDPHRSK
jgi:transposase